MLRVKAEASRVFSDTWPPDGCAIGLSSFWEGETHFELGVTTDTPLQAQTYRPPLGLTTARRQADVGRVKQRLGDDAQDFKRRDQTIGV